MKPKEKAQQLLDKMERPLNDDYYLDFNNYAKECALIAVDEIIYEVYSISHQYTAIYDITTSSYLYTDCKELIFWKEVKQEIEKI